MTAATAAARAMTRARATDGSYARNPKQALAVPAVAATALGAWIPLLGGAVLRALPVVVAVTILAAQRPMPRLTGALAMLWPPFAILIAGVPPGRLWPSEWLPLLGDLSDGAMRLAALGPGRVEDDPWPVAVWLLFTGTSWLAASALAAAPESARTPVKTSYPRQAHVRQAHVRPPVASGDSGTLLRVTGFVMLATPWVIAVTLRQADDVAWQGALILFAALMWFAPRRAAAVPVVVLGTAAALVATVTAHAFGPRDQWLTLDRVLTRQAQFSSMDTTQSYGPLRGRRTGAAMIEVTAPEPALWRMQVLDRFGWRGWEVGMRDRVALPQPAAREVDIEVQVKGLRDDMVVAPGRIRSVSADGKINDGRGEAIRLNPTPRRDDTYHVTADVVHTTADQLRAAPWPTDSRLRPYLRLSSGFGGTVGLPGGYDTEPYGTAGELRFLEQTPFQGVVELSRRLAAGARTPLEAVERVQHYLVDGNRFHYSTDVNDAGRLPLVDFLLRDRVGYCQHFAGAAALLLRMAGVPTRVVAGFATGEPTGDGRYVVRDADAHAWIEVYFEGIGWVPFNPTPAAADAEIPPELDPLAATTTTRPDGLSASTWAPAALPIGLTVGIVLVAWRRLRGRRAELGDALEWVVRRTGGRVEPSTTLSGLRIQLARVGPHSAALATAAEQARYAPDPAAVTRHPLVQVARALVADLGTPRALLVLVPPFRRTRWSRSADEAPESRGQSRDESG
jgi:transglutaminase-like putative cysteine protease